VGRQKNTSGGAVAVHFAEHDDLGYAAVTLDHDDYPRLRFTLSLSPEGNVYGLEVVDRRFLRRDPEYAIGDPRWGPLAQVTRRLLVDLPLGELESAARARVNEDRVDAASGSVELDEGTEWLADLPVMGATHKGGRPPLSDQHLAGIAELYAQRAAVGAHPVSAISKMTNGALRLPSSRDTVKRWVQEARRRGLLTDPPASGGPIRKAGGVLTERARQILEKGET
jgi:hypothetical protein